MDTTIAPTGNTTSYAPTASTTDAGVVDPAVAAEFDALLNVTDEQIQDGMRTDIVRALLKDAFKKKMDV